MRALALRGGEPMHFGVTVRGTGPRVGVIVAADWLVRDKGLVSAAQLEHGRPARNMLVYTIEQVGTRPGPAKLGRRPRRCGVWLVSDAPSPRRLATTTDSIVYVQLHAAWNHANSSFS